MTLILNQADWDELQQQAPRLQLDNLVLDDVEHITGVPEYIGRGYNHRIELSPGLWVNFYDCEYYQDLMVKAPVHEHDIQIWINLSGFIYFEAVHPNLGGMCGYFSGSGISPAYVEKYRCGERLITIGVDIEPEWLDSFLQEDKQYDCGIRKLLFKGDDWKTSLYPTVTLKMRSVAQQLWNVPYRGVARRMYLQGKVLELLAMHLDLIAAEQKLRNLPKLKPETIARLQYAKEILTIQFENPPSLSELAQQVGVSDRTLQRGFGELFGTTVFGYLHNLRMEQAEQLLRSREMRVSEVAHAVGYSHLGHFTEAFKRKFGMTPKQCQMGKVNAL
ncbi:helix-turn-helix transcriptional regulator [Gloeocapsopsis crepidinum LEGE 06123]|uniref:Helix-turn-helix transcriptional regulator n=1 Tax=Gloeocapsopsis crepidinum LEGE 06123 TaxID=588587 RepID=A0ABR9UVP1_9CHRO|nr:AraC family transcriptional regulator [Gloeocapsopsis crepidinum]MBE9192349.1 helix-turn-helix transcriptional regulator [Gloeocapsopsis crepidinum LEGE 06123]